MTGKVVGQGACARSGGVAQRDHRGLCVTPAFELKLREVTGADHGNPTCACAVGDGMVLGWAGAEGGCGVIRTELNGKKIWGSRRSAAGSAIDGRRP